jgi:hypothetical protein
VKPPHIAGYIEMLGTPEPDGAGLSKPSVKQHLAALRMLFDWLVVGHVLDVKMANHADTRTTQLYERRGDSASLGEYEMVGI